MCDKIVAIHNMSNGLFIRSVVLRLYMTCAHLRSIAAAHGLPPWMPKILYDACPQPGLDVFVQWRIFDTWLGNSGAAKVPQYLGIDRSPKSSETFAAVQQYSTNSCKDRRGVFQGYFWLKSLATLELELFRNNWTRPMQISRNSAVHGKYVILNLHFFNGW